eukprot:GHVS01029792.1.p1 GENE.GHVS01029792.1~~GHVS01029792.1.p1  ORF type:complete len:174 (-),score=59.24 GHVS01029792.1:72-593(-)
MASEILSAIENLSISPRGSALRGGTFLRSPNTNSCGGTARHTLFAATGFGGGGVGGGGGSGGSGGASGGGGGVKGGSHKHPLVDEKVLAFLGVPSSSSASVGVIRKFLVDYAEKEKLMVMGATGGKGSTGGCKKVICDEHLKDLFRVRALPLGCRKLEECMRNKGLLKYYMYV